MPEYLSKEEVKQWRSSLEKITLEEYAARLGKVIEEEKQTNDLVDIVFKDKSGITRSDNSGISKKEVISSIAQKTFEREQELTPPSFSASLLNKKPVKPTKENIKNEVKETSLKEIVQINFKKVLTDRERLVFDYFSKNRNQVVYAKDLAKLLGLPRDYVYKYIKNLRAKIEGDKLQNSENGGYILSV